jgi:hypothetical protein
MIKDVFKTNKLHFDMICFDACYTSTLNIIHKFYDITDYIISHMVYVNSEGFNSKNLCKIFDSKYSFYKKLKLSALDYIERSKSEKEHASITIIDCNIMKQFFSLYSNNSVPKDMEHIILKQKKKKCFTDLHTKYYESNSTNCNSKNCIASVYNNMLDLYNVLKILNNKELINIFNKAIYYKTNGIKLDPKYFNTNVKYNGVNIIIDISKYN